MTDVQLEKLQYVTGPLADFLESTFGGKVEGADYVTDAGNEYVHVYYAGGRRGRIESRSLTDRKEPEMQHAIARQSERPPARLPREANVTTPSRVRSGHQVGRSVRAWIAKYAAEVCITIGWAFAFAAAFIPKDPAHFAAVTECAIAAAVLFGFGIGWNVRGDGGKR